MKRTIYITEKQFNKMGLPKKVRQNLIPYGDGEERKADYELSSASGDLGYAHVVNGDAGQICENQSSEMLWYRGFDSRYGIWNTNLLWLTDEPSYAKEYGDKIAEYKINEDILNPCSLYYLDDEFDIYDGPDDEMAAELIREGYNCYSFETGNQDAIILCVFDKSIIGTPRILSDEEYNKIPPYDELSECKILNESLDPNFDLTPYINSYNDFLVREGLNVKPFPSLNLSNDDQEGVMIRTGYYKPDEKSITLFVKDRHPKDILRSYAHEMVHHMQNLENPERDWGTGGDLKEDDVLSGLESEAYEKGNMLFRKWTEELRKQPDNRLNESKQRKNDKGETVPEKCECGGKVCLQIHGEPVFVCDKCGKYFGTLPFKRTLNEELLTRGHFAKYKTSDEELEEHYKRTRDWGKKLVALRKRYDPDGIDKRFDLDEATSSDVDLSSFKIKDELNPKIWKGDKLDPKVRVKLMDIADDFFDSLGISWVKPEDVIIVGSIANYNWSEFSDIDLHIVVDYDKVDKRTKFVETFFKSKKREWNTDHSRIRICGFPVEVYVQDKSASVSSSGVYSIEKNEWIKKPVKGSFTKSDIDTYFIKSKAANIMTRIENMEDEFNGDDEVYSKADELITKITSGRKETLKTPKDEMNNDNIVFKVLRRNGYLDKLFNLRDKSYDKSKSLK